MSKPTTEIEQQVEAAYDYRGHVTVTLKDGTSLIGFIFSREFANPHNPHNHYIDVIPKDSDERRRIPIAELARIEISGKDYAAGNSFEEYNKKKQAQQSK